MFLRVRRVILAVLPATVLTEPPAAARIVRLDPDLDTGHWIEKYFAVADIIRRRSSTAGGRG
jgi:hypothetical protein